MYEKDPRRNKIRPEQLGCGAPSSSQSFQQKEIFRTISSEHTFPQDVVVSIRRRCTVEKKQNRYQYEANDFEAFIGSYALWLIYHPQPVVGYDDLPLYPACTTEHTSTAVCSQKLFRSGVGGP